MNVKTFWVVAAALAVTFGSSLALAGPIGLSEIPPLLGETASEGRCITPDGAYVGGVSGGGGIVWDSVLGTRQPVAGSAQTSVTGIGYRVPGGGGTTELVIHGDNAGYQSMNASTDGGVTWVKRRRPAADPTSAAAFGASNTMAGGSYGGNMHSTYQTPGSTTPQLYVDTWTDAGWGVRDTKGTTTESNIIGVSVAGVAVGRRKNSSGVWQSYKLVYTGTGGLAASWVNGVDGTPVGELWDISDDGSVAGGVCNVTGKTGLWAFVTDFGIATELPVLNAGTAFATNSRVYGIGPNGDYAVGMDYTNGMELAVLWDLNAGTVTDLTALAASAGVLGDFTGNLRRAYAVGVNGQGDPVVTGWGWNATAGAVRGFVLTVPEPASLTLLALGALGLLRRRRR